MFRRKLLFVAWILLSLWALGGLIAEFGFLKYGEAEPPERLALFHKLDICFIVFFVLTYLAFFLSSHDRVSFVRKSQIDTFLSVLSIMMLVVSDGSVFRYFMIGFKLIVGIVCLIRFFLGAVRLLNLTTPLLIAFSFLLIIGIGFGLLLLPVATVSGRMNSVDALFTSASATCVTGLTVVDTGTHLTPFGQIVVLGLIQIGGLGLMTFVAFFSVLMGAGLSIRTDVSIGESLDLRIPVSLFSIIKFIVLSTFLIEALGTVSIYFSFPFSEGTPFGRRLYFSVFHSISAFCNAGFSLLSDNMSRARSCISLNLTFIVLIIIGGFGFSVNLSLWRALLSLFRRRREALYSYRFGVQSRIVLLTSFALLALGMAFIYFGEAERSFAGFSEKEKILASLFQSVNARTAGFNTVNLRNFCAPVLLVIMGLMFIGASPGSTGGGVKTTTFSLFLLAIIARLRNRENVEVYGRRIPERLISNALLILFFAVILIFLCTGLVLAFGFDKEKGGDKIGRDEDTFLRVLFEVVSAFGTVGYSTGITADLSTGSKIVLIMVMFIGRIGPFTLLLAMSRQAKKMRYTYPTEGIMVG
ncbi:MAG: hypothetical protein N2234_05390 [Planctomycetota bacterium]|nr:hypothetical protein [Planctomycetota bacterium]